jgi:hypothetical protein
MLAQLEELLRIVLIAPFNPTKFFVEWYTGVLSPAT